LQMIEDDIPHGLIDLANRERLYKIIFDLNQWQDKCHTINQKADERIRKIFFNFIVYTDDQKHELSKKLEDSSIEPTPPPSDHFNDVKEDIKRKSRSLMQKLLPQSNPEANAPIFPPSDRENQHTTRKQKSLKKLVFRPNSNGPNDDIETLNLSSPVVSPREALPKLQKRKSIRYSLNRIQSPRSEVPVLETTQERTSKRG